MDKASEKENVTIHKGGEEKGKPSTEGHALTPFEEMERMFEGFFPRGFMRPFPSWNEWMAPLERQVLPKVDIIDRDNELMVRAQVPGVEKKNLNVSLTENMISIRGSISHEEKEERGNYYRRECSSGSFERNIALPSDVDSDKARATFKNGVLEITVPKTRKSSRRELKID